MANFEESCNDQRTAFSNSGIVTSIVIVGHTDPNDPNRPGTASGSERSDQWHHPIIDKCGRFVPLNHC